MTTTTPEVPPFRYTAELAGEIERAWQRRWERDGTFHTANPDVGGAGDLPEKFYLLDMFPYPSGKGLHVGHPLGYIATDVVGRYKRMTGVNVLHALAYDAFGLPAEQYAIQTGQHPRTTTEENIAVMREQLRRLGLAHDDRRSFATTDDDYVRWTQWIFLQIFDSWFDPDAVAPDGSAGAARPIGTLIDRFAAGVVTLPEPFAARSWGDLTPAEREEALGHYRLAYVADVPVNWCPGLGTVLANEEVTADGRSERGNFPVFKRNLRQWMMRITAYGDRLVADLDRLDWPEKVKAMQRNWVGRSAGATVTFTLDEGTQAVDVFTTRPDTLFGATFMVLAPEHPALDALVPAAWPEGTKDSWTGGEATPAAAVAAYRAQAAARTEAERTNAERDKTGVFSGVFATNPVNGAPLPVFIADYVLMGYGTGAIMAVPAQDERDWEFATAFDLPIVRTVQPPEGFTGGAYTGEGATINSANADLSLDGLDVASAKTAIIDWLDQHDLGEGTVTYRLRDWLFSRQRYWGEPFPVVYDSDGRVVPLPEELLPVTLPEMPDFSPKSYDDDDVTSEPEAPLGRAGDWVEVELDLGEGPKTYRRDTNTMPNWAGSCWYELRYLDPDNESFAVDPGLEQYWMGPRTLPDGTSSTGGADLYVGGVEHAVLHLLYARFWHKVLYDLGHVSSVEPFHKLFNQGYIQAYAFTDARGAYVPAEEVVEHPGDDGNPTYTHDGAPVTREYGKMGKSLKNMVTPDQMYAEYGADTFRVYEMSMGPLDLSRPWETRAVVGAHRFLQRLWRNVVSEESGEVTVADEPMDDGTARVLARTIADVRVEYEAMRPNTAIARLIVLNNHLTGLDRVPRAAVEALLVMTAPVAPHIAEELWSRLGHAETLTYEPFPTADEAKLVDETVTCVVQVAGKVRDRLEVSPDISADELEAAARASAAVARVLDGRGIRKVIVRAPKLVNIVPGE
ncbi:leucine--tRNA ligase [Pseudactinotalea sp. HY158]|uniref:leucine--tRNA ligase n=1 Tax=Pseudactinotalea sp. HY158 TaxID=2654547 RepID=UPI00129D1AF9|nr:leucine--tRNA ligase [Pseudactinotalea sp. HY158]QGH69582.1 leucine--tRNA ligase [Pseudactinotalea sp. HY158]